MKETKIDCMKYRKSTHLAGVDVEAIVSEKGKCLLTIKEAYYNTSVDVSGNKTDGYFLDFHEDVKSMVVNSTNRKKIAEILQQKTGCTSVESRNIGRWENLVIELSFDPNVQMMKKIVGGIRVAGLIVTLPALEVDTKIFTQCLNAFKSGTYTLDQIKTKFAVSEKIEKLFIL